MKTKEKTYQYIERELLDEPEYYMYSGFGGVDFLKKYISSRTKCLEYFESQTQKKDIFFKDKTIDLPEISEPRIETEKVLTSILFKFLNSKISDQDSYVEWLNFFIKRFEVTKKLYTAYQKTKPATEDCHLIRNYTLLSLSSLLFYEKYKNLKMLNCALKLNDLICSIYREIAEAEDIYLAMSSLKSEIKAVRSLASNQGIKL